MIFKHLLKFRLLSILCLKLVKKHEFAVSEELCFNIYTSNLYTADLLFVCVCGWGGGLIILSPDNWSFFRPCISDSEYFCIRNCDNKTERSLRITGNLSSLIRTTVAMGMGLKVVLGTDEYWQFAIGIERASVLCVCPRGRGGAGQLGTDAFVLLVELPLWQQNSSHIWRRSVEAPQKCLITYYNSSSV